MTITLYVSGTGGESTLLAPTMYFQVGYDTGVSHTDLLTSNANMRFEIVLTQGMLGDWIKVYDGASLAYTISETTGFVEANAYTWTEGEHSITAKYGRDEISSYASTPLVVTLRTTPPILSAAAGTATGSTSADITFSTNLVEGTYWYVVDTNLSTPTALQIRAGLNAANEPALRTGTGAVTASPITDSVTGLWYDTDFRVYATQRDDTALDATPVASATFTTDALTSPQVWSSGVQVNGNPDNPTMVVEIDTPGPSLLIVFGCTVGEYINGVTFDGGAPTQDVMETGYYALATKEFTGPATTTVMFDTDSGQYTTLGYVILIGAGANYGSVGGYNAASGTQPFATAVLPTNGIGLAILGSVFGGAAIPTAWSGATRLPLTEGSQGQVAIGMALVTGSWGTVTCSCTHTTQFPISTSWTFDP